MIFVSNILKGIALGAGAILPGISSGVLCVIFGIYEKLLDSLLNFFKNFKENINFLFPLFIGIGLGIIIFSNFLQYFLINFPIQTNSIFIGLILGTVPSLIKTLKFKKNTQKKSDFFVCIASFAICFIIGIISIIIESLLPISNTQCINYLYLILSGFLMSVGIVVPRSKQHNYFNVTWCIFNLLKCYIHIIFQYINSNGNGLNFR